MLVNYAKETYAISEHRACRLLKVSRSVYRYVATTIDDQEIESVLLALAKQYRRYGFYKMFCKTRQLGHQWNHKRVYRVYRALGLNLRSKPQRRRLQREKQAIIIPKRANESWSLDFMSDALKHGQRFRTVNLIDDCNREALGIRAALSLPAVQVTMFLDDIAATRGYPNQLRLDNGPENISQAMVNWAKEHQVMIHYIQPGKPAQNALIERFNRTYREEVLNMHLFKNITQVQTITDQWLHEYNYDRPHQALGDLSPKQFMQAIIPTCSLY